MSISEINLEKPMAGAIRTCLQHYGPTILVQGLTLGLGVLTGILSARMLGPVGRGEYAATIVWPMGIASFLAFGVNQALVYHLGQRTFSASEAATAAAVIGAAQGALSVAIGLVIVPLVLAKYSETVHLLGILFVFFTPVMILSVYPGNLFQGMQNLPRFNLIRVLAPLTYTFALIGMYATHYVSLGLVIYSQLAGYVLSLAVGAPMACSALRLRLRWKAKAISSLLNYGVRIQGLSIATFVNQRIDQLVLSLLVPPRELGLYAVAVSLSSALAVFPQAAGIVAFSRGSSQEGDSARGTIRYAFRASLIWLLAVGTVLFVSAPFLIRLVFGARFEGSILACRILIPGALMTGLSFVLYNAASAIGRPGLSSVAEGVSVFVTAMGLFLLVPRYGYIGAAIVSSVAYTISFLMMVVLVHRKLGLSLRNLLISDSQNP